MRDIISFSVMVLVWTVLGILAIGIVFALPWLLGAFAHLYAELWTAGWEGAA